MNLMDVDKGALQVLGSKKVGSQSDCPECWRSGLGSRNKYFPYYLVDLIYFDGRTDAVESCVWSN